jgi:hypothetical protein
VERNKSKSNVKRMGRKGHKDLIKEKYPKTKRRKVRHIRSIWDKI